VVTFDGAPVDVATARTMAAAAPYRAVHGTRDWRGAGAAFVHQALHVTHEDPHDRQPLARAGLVCVADARLDNRDELLPILAARGFVVGDPPSIPDVELILGAYRCWGRACADRLLGDFAFVVWDTRSRQLFAARDPMGMRALYLRVEPRRRVLFATEAQQLLAAPGVPREIDELSLAANLSGPFVPPDRSSFRGIAQLPAGHATVIDAETWRTWRHWQPDPSLLRVSDEEAAAGYRDVLESAVRSRLRTLDPVGISLSGGLDSCSLTSMAGWLRQQGRGAAAGLHAYQWAFDELEGADERGVSGEVVRAYPIEGHAVLGDDCWPLCDYDRDAPDHDDPFRWPYEALQERTRHHARNDGVRVFLTGSRGDEVTGDWAFDELGLLRHGRGRAAFEDVRLLAEERRTTVPDALVRRLVRPTLAHRFPILARPLRPGRRPPSRPPWPPWIPEGFARRVGLGDVIAEATAVPSFDGLARSVRYDRIANAQSARLAAHAERAEARHGLVAADPFSDRRLVEFVLSLPAWQVQRRSAPKQLVRASLGGILPDPVRRGARKNIPVTLFDRGLRERGVEAATRLLTDPIAASHGWLDADVARAVLSQYQRTKKAPADPWWPLTTEWWLRRWWT
jgi:asparagine synthase (glutamine-hydrolysing)